MTSSNSGVCAGSSQPGGLVILATLSALVSVFTRPTSSRMTFSPTPGTTVGDVTWIGTSRVTLHGAGRAWRPVRRREPAQSSLTETCPRISPPAFFAVWTFT